MGIVIYGGPVGGRTDRTFLAPLREQQLEHHIPQSSGPTTDRQLVELTAMGTDLGVTGISPSTYLDRSAVHFPCERGIALRRSSFLLLDVKSGIRAWVVVAHRPSPFVPTWAV